MFSGSLREVVEGVIRDVEELGADGARERHEGLFVGPEHFDDLIVFVESAPRGVEIVEAGEYLLLYHRGQERGLGLVAATWLFYDGREMIESLADRMERLRCMGERCNPFTVGLRVASLYGLAAVVGVDAESDRIFFHPLPPALAAFLHLVPPEHLGDEDLVRELMGFDLNPWESRGAREGRARLRVQGDLVLDLRPIRSGGFESFLSLAASLAATPWRIVDAFTGAAEALAGLPATLPVDRLEAMAGDIVAEELRRIVPCPLEVRVSADRPLPALASIRVDLSGATRDDCRPDAALGELAPVLSGIEENAMRTMFDFDNVNPINLLLGPLTSELRSLLEGSVWGLARSVNAVLRLCQAAGDSPCMDAEELTVAARGRGSAAVVRYHDDTGRFYRLAYIVEALRVRARLAVGDTRPVEEALGARALAGPLIVSAGRHTLRFSEASLVRLPPVLADFIRYPDIYNSARQALEALGELMPGESGGNEATLLENAWRNPAEAKKLATALIRLYHYTTTTPQEAILVTSPQALAADHPEHGTTSVNIPRPALATIHFIPRATLEAEEEARNGEAGDEEDEDSETNIIWLIPHTELRDPWRTLERELVERLLEALRALRDRAPDEEEEEEEEDEDLEGLGEVDFIDFNILTEGKPSQAPGDDEEEGEEEEGED